MVFSKDRQKFSLIIFFVFLIVLYIHNLSRSVYGGDVGDLVTASFVGGVSHPPGYPLFTFLGFLLTRINFMTPAFMVGLISVFSSVFSVVLYYYLALEFTKNKFISFISTLTLAFNYFFWFYAEIAEVFALNNFFVVALIFFTYFYYKYKKTKYLYILSFFIGLSATNQQMIVFIFPSIAILVLANFKKIFSKPKTIFKSLLLILLGFSIYLYVPIASFHNPVINWDRVKDIKSFLHLFLRQDYGTFSAGPIIPPTISERVVILKAYLVDIIVQLTLPVILLSLLGCLYLFLNKKKVLLIALLLGFFLSGPLFIFYAGFPLASSFFIGIYERFFAMSSVIVLILFPFGLLYFINFLNGLFKKKTFQNIFIAVFLIIPLSLFRYNFPKTDLHNVSIGDDLAYDMISPLPKNSILFLAGDTVLFNAWYQHYALNLRPDIRIVNLNGIAGDSFLEAQTANYVKTHPKERNDKDLIIKTIKVLSLKQPIFSYETLQPQKGKNFAWVPYGLSFELLNSEEEKSSEADFLNKTSKIWSAFRYAKNYNLDNLASGSYTIADLPSVYSNALLATGDYVLSQYKDQKSALYFFDKARNVDPFYYKVYEVLGVYYLSTKDCRNTSINFTKALDIYPYDSIIYYLLYSNYINCKDNNSAKNLIKSYNQIYKSNFSIDYNSYTKNLNKK